MFDGGLARGRVRDDGKWVAHVMVRCVPLKVTAKLIKADICHLSRYRRGVGCGICFRHCLGDQLHGEVVVLSGRNVSDFDRATILCNDGLFELRDVRTRFPGSIERVADEDDYGSSIRLSTNIAALREHRYSLEHACRVE